MLRIIALFTFSYILRPTSSDWVSEWMSPIQEQLVKENPARRTNNDYGASILDEENLKMVQVVESTETVQNQMVERFSASGSPKTGLSTGNLKAKLESTLQSAKILADTLKVQIKQVSERENLLKAAIVNGRSGVSTVVVTPINRAARSYIVRDGAWTLCRGVIRVPGSPPSSRMYNEIVATPKCYGHEMSSQPDPCVFNSIIKYETVPTVRRAEYYEDDYLCLKQTFNTTLERYMSVPRQIMNQTCHGMVRSLEDNNAKCGVRVISEYSYYPLRGYGTDLPLEYCAENDGSCKFIMAWHVSNTTIENFEFLKNELGFKKYFIKSEGVLEHVM